MPRRRELIATGIRYYSSGDEDAFFEWLRRIGCVGTLWGAGPELVIPLIRRPSNSDLRELLALFRRYEVDMRQLARFAGGKDRAWFIDPTTTWHRAVFGER
jgi:hypothetical protein